MESEGEQLVTVYVEGLRAQIDKRLVQQVVTNLRSQGFKVECPREEELPE